MVNNWIFQPSNFRMTTEPSVLLADPLFLAAEPGVAFAAPVFVAAVAELQASVDSALVFVALLFAAAEPGVAFAAPVFVAAVAEPQAFVDIALAFEVLAVASVAVVEADSHRRPKYFAFPNVDHCSNSSSSVEVVG